MLIDQSEEVITNVGFDIPALGWVEPKIRTFRCRFLLLSLTFDNNKVRRNQQQHRSGRGETKKRNCRIKDQRPLEGECLTDNVVYSEFREEAKCL